MPIRPGLVIIAIVVSTIFAIAKDTPSSSLYLEKCAPCHGRTGQGKSSTKAPSLVSDKVKSMSDDNIRELIRSRANGEMERNPAHTGLKTRLSETQINAIVADIRQLQEKHKQ